MRHRACSQPAQGEAITLLAQLAGVDRDDLAAFLATRWAPGAETAALARLDALRNTHARRAAAARREQAERPLRDVRVLIDEKRRQMPSWSKKRAFDWLARELSKSPETIRNAYYAQCPIRDSVITLSRVSELQQLQSKDDEAIPGELAALGS